MRTVVLIAMLAGCGFSKSSNPTIGDGQMIDAKEIDAVPIDGPPGAARKRRITIPDAKIFGTLSAFPVWLVIDDMPGLGAKATTPGNDIYFTKIDGTPLEHQRIAWTKATGHLEEWVKVDLMDGMANEIDLRFGDAGPAHAPDAPAVWTNGFLAVWHMDDTLSGNTVVADARGAVMGVAANGPVSTANGKLGRAIDFDGNNDEVTFTSPLTGAGSSTISAWVSLAQPAQGFSSVMCIGTNANNASRFLHTKYTGLGYGYFGNDVQTNVDIHNSQFTLLHWVYDAGTTTSTLYRDGVVVGTPDSTGAINTTGTGGAIGTAPMAWGPGGNTTNPVNGLLDEVRISSAPRNLGWIRTEHANQSEVTSFFTLGPDVPAQ